MSLKNLIEKAPSRASAITVTIDGETLAFRVPVVFDELYALQAESNLWAMDVAAGKIAAPEGSVVPADEQVLASCKMLASLCTDDESVWSFCTLAQVHWDAFGAILSAVVEEMAAWSGTVEKQRFEAAKKNSNPTQDISGDSKLPETSTAATMPNLTPPDATG